MKGLVSQTLDWLTHPLYSEGNLLEWSAFLALIILGSVLWAQVVRQIE